MHKNMAASVMVDYEADTTKRFYDFFPGKRFAQMATSISLRIAFGVDFI